MAIIGYIFFSSKQYIEKKRRDRLNNSLLELKRLVPKAIERELSEKLEKADILRLAVDYLKAPNESSKQVNDVDYKEMGFGDCISEISKFFSDTDSLQTPVHQRMLSHLQYFTRNADSQREIRGGMCVPGSNSEILILQNRILFNAVWLNFVRSFCGGDNFKF